MACSDSGSYKDLIGIIREYLDRTAAYEIKLAGLDTKLDCLFAEVKIQGEKTRMALSDTETKLLKSFDDLTNVLATEVERIVGVIQSLNTDDPEFNTQLQTQVDKLDAVKTALQAAGKTPPVVVPPGV